MCKTFLAAAALIVCGAAPAAMAASATIDAEVRPGTASWMLLTRAPAAAASALEGVTFDAVARQRAFAAVYFDGVELHDFPPADHGTRVPLHVENSTGVPEPGTIAMLVAGLGMVAVLRRRLRPG